MQEVESTINGIDVAELRGAMEAIKDDPSKGVAKFQVATRWNGGTKTETKVNSWALGGVTHAKNFTIRTDEPVELLGSNTQPNPQEVLMAGLNACMTVGYATCCAARGIELESLEIQTEGELDLRGFLNLDPSVKPGYDGLRYTVRMRGNGTPEQFREIHEMVMRTSPNYWNLANKVRLMPQLIVD